MKMLDLFSGIGGFSLAAEWAGIETIAFCEKDLFCQKVLKKHWPHIPIHDDIKTLTSFPVDLITAGFPCQPFSVAGNRKGKDDDRYLWPDTIRVIRGSKPSWVILENVPGIIPMLDPILEDLENAGYKWQAFIIPASAIGAPHKRDRLWIIANSNSERCDRGLDNRERGQIQIDWQQHITSIQSEWPQFFPKSWEAFSPQKWLDSDTISEQCKQGTKNKQTDSKRSERSQLFAENRNDQPGFGWQKDKPPVSGMDDGVPNGLDRNRALGNSIVPQIPYLFMRIILSISDQPSST